MAITGATFDSTTNDLSRWTVAHTWTNPVTVSLENIRITQDQVFNGGATFTNCFITILTPTSNTATRLAGNTSYERCFIRYETPTGTGTWNKVGFDTLNNVTIVANPLSLRVFPYIVGSANWNNVTLNGAGQVVFDSSITGNTLSGISHQDTDVGFWNSATNDLNLYDFSINPTATSQFVQAGGTNSVVNIINGSGFAQSRTRVTAVDKVLKFSTTRNIQINEASNTARKLIWDKERTPSYDTTSVAGVFPEDIVVDSESTNAAAVGGVTYDNKILTQGITEIIIEDGYFPSIFSTTNVRAGTPSAMNGGVAENSITEITQDALAIANFGAGQAALLNGDITIAKTDTVNNNGIITVLASMDLDILYSALHIWYNQNVNTYRRSAVDGALDVRVLAERNGSDLLLKDWDLHISGTGVLLNAGTTLSKVIYTGGSVSEVNGGSTNFEYIVTDNQTNLRLSNVVAGSSISVIDNSGTEIADVQNLVAGDNEIIFPFTFNQTVTVRVMTDGYVMQDNNVDVFEGIVKFSLPDMQKSNGQINTANRIRQVDGVNIGLGASSFIDANTTTKTFDVINGANTRSVMTGIMLSWDEPELNHITQPCVVDDVRGLTLSDGWSFTAGSITNFLRDEGYVERDNLGAVTDFKYNVKIQDNPTNVDVIYQVYNDLTPQGEVTVSSVTGGNSLNTLIDIDHTLNDVFIRIKAKHPQFQYKTVLENIVQSGDIVADRYKIQDTNYLVASDPIVTEDLRSGYNVDYTYTNTSVDVDDFGGTARTFDNGTVDLLATTLTVQEVINQLAGLTSSEFDFNTKLFTLRSDGGIDVDGGYYITVGGASLAGSLRGLIHLYDENGTEFATPEFRNIVFDLPVTWTNGDFNYVCILDNANALTNTPDILSDADGNNVEGTITSGSSKTVSIETNVDTPIRFIYGNENSVFEEHVETLDADGIIFTMVATEEVVKLYRDEALANDNALTGEKAWYPEIDNITIETLTRRFIVPDAIVTAEVNYIYRSWRKWVEADYNRLKYGIALVGRNILKPSSADDDDNTYLFNPEWSFGFSWRMDVLDTRPTATVVKFSASRLDRIDNTQGFGILHDGLAYVAPLSNGGSPIELIVVGATNKTLTDIQSGIQDVYNLTKTTGVELKSTDRDTLEDIPTLGEIEASTIIAKEETSGAIKLRTDNMPQG